MATRTADTRRVSIPRGYFRALWERRWFIRELAFGNIMGKHATDMLGVLWWVLNPLMMTGVYFLVFGVILGGRRGDPAFLAYLLVGVFAMRYMSGTMVGSAKMITGGGKLITTIAFPRMVLPLAAMIEDATAFLAALGSFYFLVAPINSIWPTWWLLFFPVPFLLHSMFVLGMGALTARLVVPIRDIRNVVPHLTRMWFYLTPILWTLDRIEGAATWIQVMVKANPMFSFLSLYRTALMSRPFEPVYLATSAAWAVVILVFGVWTFIRHEGSMARYL
ncbi:MAG: ABC transporter permease [Actinobacteria bacterium]|nr:ABC transporter permease [Actinomycetota bacterium]